MSLMPFHESMLGKKKGPSRDKNEFGGLEDPLQDDLVEAPVESSPTTDTSSEEAKPWLMFGIDGKTKQQLITAITTGNRRFDTAESYGNIDALKGAIDETGLKRAEYKVTYKFDVNSDEKSKALKSRLMAVANKFGTRLDDLIIHNTEGEDAVTTAWGVMAQLKAFGMADRIGLGNVKASQKDLLTSLDDSAKIDVYEQSVSSIIGDDELAAMLGAFKNTEVLYYNVVQVAQQMGIGDEDGIKYLMAKVTEAVQGSVDWDPSKARAVMSSGSEERQGSNLASFGDGSAQAEEPSLGHEKDANLWNWKLKCSESDRSWQIPGGVHSVIMDMGQKPEEYRQRISDSASVKDQQTPEEIRSWITSNTAITTGDLDSVLIPERKFLQRSRVGTPLGKVLEGFFSKKSCDRKATAEELNLMIMDVDTWDIIGSGFDLIV